MNMQLQQNQMFQNENYYQNGQYNDQISNNGIQNFSQQNMNGMPQNQPIMDPFMACNQGIANGFGAMFYNMRDQTIQKSNLPVKAESSMHIPILALTLLYIAGVIVGIIGFRVFL
jgi:hypothetical protein